LDFGLSSRPANRQASNHVPEPAPLAAVRSQEARVVNVEVRVAVKDESARLAPTLGLFQRPGSSQQTPLLYRIVDADSERPAVDERRLDLVSPVADAKDEAAEALSAQEPDLNLQKRFRPDARQTLGPITQDRPQPSPQPTGQNDDRQRGQIWRAHAFSF
jgi:hypothetical protein